MLKVFKTVCGLLALGFWFSAYLLTMHYVGQPDTACDLASGRTFPMPNHGTVVYLTALEHYLIDGLRAAGVLFFVLAAAAYWRSGEWRRLPGRPQARHAGRVLVLVLVFVVFVAFVLLSIFAPAFIRENFSLFFW